MTGQTAKRVLLPVGLLFLALAIHGLWPGFGLTDDEAYYWVLGQRPAWGYAFHPGGIGIFVAIVHRGLGWLMGYDSVAVVRLPAFICSAAVFGMGLRWLQLAGGVGVGELDAEGRRRWRAGVLGVLSLVGLFAISWMMVPDFPLFLGWTIAFLMTWKVCEPGPVSGWVWFWLVVGIFISFLGKYSAFLGAGSAGLCILLWAPRERRVRGAAYVVLGCVLGAIPIILWNAAHEWGSILYQIRERHGDGNVSWIRYGRFWAIELIIAGPAVFAYAWMMVLRGLRRKLSRAEAYAGVWALPAALIFFTQPLKADFKPHWALIVWWPVVLSMAWVWSTERVAFPSWLKRAQLGYAAVMSVIVFVACHWPIGGWVLHAMSRDGQVNPKLDVTNDMYGWPDLRAFIAEIPEARDLKIVGSRYQTAGQAAFSMGDSQRTTLLPRDVKAFDEWPSLGVSETEGPGWPKLTKPVIFVADSRYDAGPEYPGARCEKRWTLSKKRGPYPAKEIYLWRCDP